MVRLDVTLDGAQVTSKAMEGDRLRIGRGRDNELYLDAKELSVYHAELVRYGDVVELRDLKSSNGTFLNGRRVERAVLNDADLLGLGRYVVEVSVETKPGAQPDVENRLLHGKLAETVRLTAAPTAPAANEQVRAHILYQHPRWEGARQALMHGEALRIGSGKDMDLRLWGMWVPRCMAMIVRGPAGYSLLSFAPDRSWVKHAGQVVEERVPLKSGDELQLRDLKAVFRVGPPPAGAA